MVTIIKYNSNQLLDYLMKRFDNFDNNPYFQYQMKIAIYLFFTDKYEASENMNFHLKPFVCTLFCKYFKYIKDQMYYFKYMISSNNVYVNSISSLQSPYSNNIEKMESIEKIIKFMKPYDCKNIKSPVSVFIYYLISKIKNFENRKKTVAEILKNTIFSNLLFHTSSLQMKINNLQLFSEMNFENIEKTKEILIEQSAHLKKYKYKIDDMIDLNNEYSMILKNEKKYNFQKEYCKKTILLDVDLMKLKLDEDVIGHIKSFIEPEFLEKFRISLIKKRYFKNPRKKISELLKSFSVHQLLNICKNNLFLLYKSKEISEDDYLNSEISRTNDSVFMNDAFIDSLDECHNLFDTDILQEKNKKRLIEKIIKNKHILEYYEFQKELFILNQIIQKRRRNEGEL